MSRCKYCNEDVTVEVDRYGYHDCDEKGMLSGSFLMSALIGAATGSALLGGLLGGDLLGGILGDSLDGDLFD